MCGLPGCILWVNIKDDLYGKTDMTGMADRQTYNIDGQSRKTDVADRYMSR